ncbi:MAG: putative manganese-dependent inorganic diphosphatase [Erysipelotrichia bacterium]|nr:putative manganese-dependent inorganic diphosphatase [Erysipelotrichia bacterium]
MDQNDTIYITGHMHPDSDSIASAIGYAFFKRARGTKAVPCRLGKLNAETSWLLKRFGFEEPILLEDARKTLAEIDKDSPISISPEMTIYETIMEMQKQKRTAFCVTDHDGTVLGMVTKSDLTTIGLGDTASGIELLAKTSIDDICSTINGSMIYRDTQYHLNGKVSIIALTAAKLENYEIKDRIVIVGDDSDAQAELIRKGAGLLIVVWAKKISDQVIETAREYHCPVIISGHGSMNTSRYVYFAPPVKLVMTKNLIVFHTSELAEDAARKMMSTRYRTYPVLDAQEHLTGYVSRYHIMNFKNKKIILVDHNEFSQSVRAVEKSQLLEVVDHHRICDFATSQPVSFRNEIVGSTATIIATMYRENQIPIPQNMAGLLLGALLSDTLMFQSPTTTPKDHETADILAALANLDIDDFGREMFAVQADTSSRNLADLLNQDVKVYEVHSIKVMIAQMMVADLKQTRADSDRIQQEVDDFAEQKGADFLIAAFTSVLDKGSVLFGGGEYAAWLSEAYPNEAEETHCLQLGVLSRKSQILPRITEIIDRHA